MSSYRFIVQVDGPDSMDMMNARLGLGWRLGSDRLGTDMTHAENMADQLIGCEVVGYDMRPIIAEDPEPQMGLQEKIDELNALVVAGTISPSEAADRLAEWQTTPIAE